MRAYRPGLMGGEEFEDELDQNREEKLVVYTERANAGLPLFDVHVDQMKAPASQFLSMPEGGAIAF